MANSKEDIRTRCEQLELYTGKLAKLEIIFKVPKGQRNKSEALAERIIEIIKDEEPLKVENLKIPTNLVCAISGEIMLDPVLIESGISYDRESILSYFHAKKEEAVRRLERMADNGEEFDEANFFKCPVSMKVVRMSGHKPTFCLTNKRLKQAVEHFLEHSPWAYEYNPKHDYKQACMSQK
mmetsp:Transcript_8463/g.11654  ORF Transcript_8463/g.11654 Transcript_8463/m.11654 type:complete len:181 (-) Transcript_8463:33-575(-)